MDWSSHNKQLTLILLSSIKAVVGGLLRLLRKIDVIKKVALKWLFQYTVYLNMLVLLILSFGYIIRLLAK